MYKKIDDNFEEGLTEQQRQTLLSQEEVHERCPASHTFPEHESFETKKE